MFQTSFLLSGARVRAGVSDDGDRDTSSIFSTGPLSSVQHLWDMESYHSRVGHIPVEEWDVNFTVLKAVLHTVVQLQLDQKCNGLVTLDNTAR